MSISRATILLEGRVGQDPKLSFSKNGKAIARFSVAVNDRVKGDDGEWTDGEVQWFDITAFGYLAEDVAEDVVKGVPVVVQGRFKLETWQDQDGGARTTPTVIADWVGLKPRSTKQDGGKPTARRNLVSVADHDADAPF